MQPDPQVLSKTVQEWRGERYYLCGFYFQRYGRRLHREVWKAAHGDVPKGSHVHHANGDRSDNRLANLALLSAGDHAREHFKGKPCSDKKLAAVRQNVKAASAANRQITPEDRADASRRGWERAPWKEYVCSGCGEGFVSRAVRPPAFCSTRCFERIRSRRRRAEAREARASVRSVGAGTA